MSLASPSSSRRKDGGPTEIELLIQLATGNGSVAASIASCDVATVSAPRLEAQRVGITAHAYREVAAAEKAW